jgi:WD40 repeat protein
MRNLYTSLESTRNKSQILNAHARAIVELKHYGKPIDAPIPCEFYCVTSELKLILVKVKIGQVPKVEIISTKFELPDCKNPLPTAAMKLFGTEAFAVGTCQGHINVYNNETNEAQKLHAHVGKGRHGVSALRWKNGIWSCGNDGCVKQWTKTLEKGWICATVIRLKVESPIGFDFHNRFMYYYGSKGAEFHLYREEHRLISCWSGGRQRPTSFAFLDSPSTHSLVFVNKGRVHELDICAREVEANLNGGSGHTDKINSVEFATIAGKLVKVTTSDDCSVRLNGKQFSKPATMCASAMSAPDEKMIVCLGSKETLALYRYRARLDQFIAYEKIDVGRARKRDYDESGLARFTSAVLWNKNGSTLYLVAFCANSSARMFEIRLPRYEFEEVFSFKMKRLVTTFSSMSSDSILKLPQSTPSYQIQGTHFGR